jgi:hypothetical protein
LKRSALEEQRAVVPRISRRQIRDAEQRSSPVARERRVIVEQPRRPDRLSDAIAALSRDGYEVAWIESHAAAEPARLAAAAFVICSSLELQHAAYRAQTPSLFIDARDPFTAYPVRRDSLFVISTVVDLDTGRTLTIPELLTERYFRNTRNCGYRGAAAAEIAGAVEEMVAGIHGGWADTDAQARFRNTAADAGMTLAPRVRHIVEWDAGSGFLGDGRLARVQAERAL